MDEVSRKLIRRHYLVLTASSSFSIIADLAYINSIYQSLWKFKLLLIFFLFTFITAIVLWVSVILMFFINSKRTNFNGTFGITLVAWVFIAFGFIGLGFCPSDLIFKLPYLYASMVFALVGLLLLIAAFCIPDPKYIGGRYRTIATPPPEGLELV